LVRKYYQPIASRGFSSGRLAEFIRGVGRFGKSERRALESLLTRLLEHLLKLTYWQSQRDYNQAGWKKEIRNFRIQIKKILKESPSLKLYLREILQECYLDARNLLIDETELDASIFPLEVLANLEEILDQNWLPDWEAISKDSEQCN
jgi:hypothetical protein